MVRSLQGLVKMSCREEFRPSSSSSYFLSLSLLIIFHFNPVATTSVPNFIWNLCYTDANYTANSTFHTNLNLLLSYLSSSSTAATGFHNDTIGRRPPDQVFGLALCRGDLSFSDCQGCLNASVTQITQSCPAGMSSAIWYDICMLRYSNTNFFSTDSISYMVYQTNVNNASDPQIFTDKLGNLMNSLATEARSSSKLFAAGNMNATSFTTIYGLVQCTRDLYAGECYNCLLDAVGSIPTYCRRKQGCKVLQLSCNIRYEIYPFYNISATEIASPPLSSSPVSPPPGNEVTMTGPVFIANKCPTDASSTANNAYQSNLNLLLSYLSSTTAAAAGFYKDTIGRPPDQVYGLALCQGDLSPSVCQGCLNASVTRITQRCPKRMRSTIWFDVCMLRYSSINFFSTPDNSIEFTQINTNNASNPLLLNFQLGILMNSLVTKAARSSPKMFAADNVSLTSSTNIYGLEQCTRDLSADDCYNCLLDAVETIAHLSSGSQGFTVLGQSCSIRYEIYPFYNISYATEVASPPPPLTGKRNSVGRRILFSGISIAAALALICAIFIYRVRTKSPLRRRRLLAETLNHNDQNEIRAAESLLFDLETIRIATDNFSDRNKLGEGGFGPVYKGTLENGEHVAVKRLSRSSGQGLDELKNEVFLVAKLRHRNLVRLLGCCIESEEKLLVYNYLPNTSLDKFLFDNSKREHLDWSRRFKILEGISRGLLYLHEDSPLKIIHRDLKASNILLDVNMNPKISDFGLAKLFGGDETQGNTNRIAGTLGYMAPEYALHGLFSVKSDVYSYGVLILEIMTGQRNNVHRGSEYPIELVTHVVWRHWTQGSALQVIDQGLVEQCQAQQILRCIQIGLLCVQEDPIQRPTIANVVLMLNSHFVALPTPSAPAYFSNRNTTSKSNGVLMINSENDVSISVLEPR